MITGQNGMYEKKLVDHCSLVVSSCDKYETVWYPYFELIRKYWPDRPKDIYLITETRSYAHKGLNIICVNAAENECTWSERLYRCLSQIRTKYIIFSLEDFFLLDRVKNERIEECFAWMEENPKIAVCRLAISDHKGLKVAGQYGSFRIAGDDIGYRLDTQFALWNREALMGFLDMSESPWEFETFGTKRIIGTDKIFLWNYAEDDFDIDQMIVPYRIRQTYGYGIAWSRWLWENKQWFEKNDIYNVNYKKLGSISEKHVKRRIKYLYHPSNGKIGRAIRDVYQMIVYVEKAAQNIRIYGRRKGIRLIVGEYSQIIINKCRRSLYKYHVKRRKD